jgi:general secretion pathway protein A
VYLPFYKLQHPPFHTTPDPDFLYLSPSHKQALGSIIYGIQERKGFIAVTGEVGLGKTTILRSYLSQFDDAQNKMVYLFNPNLSYKGLLKAILRELHQEVGNDEELELLSRLHGVLVDQYRQGKTVIVLIDEAQNMPVATLENLRMLSNLETTKDKLIQIVMVGQPELNELLEQYDLRQLNQRIAVRATIVPLSTRESYEYIQDRLARAGSRHTKIFTNRALTRIVKEAKGNPRRINVLCDNALVTGLGYRRKPVTARIVKEVIADLDGTTQKVSWKWATVSAGICFFAILIGWSALDESHGFSTASYAAKLRDWLQQGVEMAKLQVNFQPEKEKSIVARDEAGSTQQEAPLPDESLANEEPSQAGAPPDMKEPLAVSMVREGDTLENLARKVYGTSSSEHMKQILDVNPHIADSKRIFPGQRIVFPKLPTAHSDGGTERSSASKNHTVGNR